MRLLGKPVLSIVFCALTLAVASVSAKPHPPKICGEGGCGSDKGVIFRQSFDGLSNHWSKGSQGDSLGKINASVNGDSAMMPYFDAAQTYNGKGKSCRLFVNGGAATAFRSEIALAGYNRNQPGWQGKTHWIGYAMRLDPDYPIGDASTSGAALVQLHSAGSQPGKSPTWGLRAMAKDGSLYVQQEFEKLPNQTYNTGLNVKDIRGRWVKVVWEVRYSGKPDGYIRLWFDDKLVFSKDKIVTFEPTAERFGFYKFGLYAAFHKRYPSTTKDKSIWIDELTIADADLGGTYATVAP